MGSWIVWESNRHLFFMPRKYLPETGKQLVIKRADGCCEYCKSPMKYSPQPYTIDHIIPLAQKGSNSLENLALACGGCNAYKYTKTEALDPITGELVPLYHPRKETWIAHFDWDADFLQIIGITPSGRATVRALNLNRPELVNLREILLFTGEHPPLHL